MHIIIWAILFLIISINGALAQDAKPEDKGRAVSVAFRMVEEKSSPEFEKFADPKTGAFIYLRPEAVIENSALKEAHISVDPVWNKPVIKIALNEMARQKFEKFTTSNIGRRVAILIDGVVVKIVMIQERISSGQCIISGDFNQQEAERIAAGIMLAPDKPSEIAIKNPEDTVRDYFSALRDWGVIATGSFMHPEALAKFKEMLLPLFEVEYSNGQKNLLKVFFGNDATIETVRKSSSIEFYNSFMLIASASSGLSDVRFESLSLIGSVKEGDIIHVLGRAQTGAGSISVGMIEVVSLKRYGQEWKMLLSGKIEGIAEALRQQIRSKPDNTLGHDLD